MHICQQLGWFEQIPAIDLSKYEIFHFDVEDCQSPQRKLLYAAHILGRVAKITPSSLRSWKNTLPKGQRSMVEKRFEDYYSPTLISRELSRIRRSDDLKKTSNNLQAKILQTSTNCSIVAKYSMEEFAISLTITIPPAFPLDPVTVAGGERLGISEAKWRTWLLASQTLFNSENISIIDGLFLWKNNIYKSFAGMESCPICYCIFHPSDRSLPGPSCKTCKNKYHATCLYKWFKSGGNATCPMCRSVF